MPAASNYTRTNVLNAMLRGVAFPLPAGTWVSLHTADPTSAGTPSTEVQTSAWPAYVRRKAEGAGALGTGWSAPNAQGESKNANQLTYPSHDGLADITITHWAVWDAASGGNMLTFAPFQTPRTLKAGDIFVIDANALTVSQS